MAIKPPAKEYLKSIATMNAKINLNLQHISDLREKMMTVGSPGNLDATKVQSSSKGSAVYEDLIILIDDAEREANRTIDEYIDLKQEAIGYVSQLEDKDQIDILRLRYFEEKTFEEIAVTICMSWRHTVRVHGHALQNLQKIMDK